MATVLDAITEFGNVGQGKPDKEVLKIAKQTIKAIETRNSKWPSTQLCKVVHNLKDNDRDLFLLIIKDMEQGLIEAYGDLDE